MRLECNVFISIRKLNGDCKCGRPSRGYLGLGHSSSIKDGDKMHFYLLVQHRSKKPEKFKVNKAFVSGLLKNQTNSGKATIMFSQPAVNVFISEADPNKLRAFLTALQQILDNNTLDERQCLKSWEANCSQSEIASAQTRRLHIFQRSDYPRTSSFPSSLVELKIVGIGLKSVDFRWFNLHQLKILDLSRNRLGAMTEPIEWRKFENIRKLQQLEELNLSDNELISFPVLFCFIIVGMYALVWGHQLYTYVSENEFYDALPISLVSLNLSINRLQHLSEKLCRLKKLKTLSLNYNELWELPEDLCMLNELRSLTVSDNRLVELPGALFSRRNYRRFGHLDISNNTTLMRSQRRRRLLGFKEVPDLCYISAASLLNNFPNFDICIYDDPLPRWVRAHFREWLRRCSICFILFPRSDSTDESNFISARMGDYADMYSGPDTLHIEQFYCTKCLK